jgi:hypothetical protein
LERKVTGREKLLEALQQVDGESRGARADRIEWLAPYTERPTAIMGAVEAMQLMEEARVSFISGHFVAALLLAASFIEHTLSEELESVLPAKSRPNFQQLIEVARTQLAVPAELLDRTESIRVLRNPFTHLRPHDDPDTLGNRFRARRLHPRTIMEEDAKLAVSTMYEWFRGTMRQAP